jgi:hypothetical protein
MTGGHQIIKMRHADRTIPNWAKDDKKVRAILLRSFPELKTNPTQRTRAARWATVIQLYYRMRMTPKQVAGQMTLNLNTTRMLIRNIGWAAKGKKANGLGNFTGRPKGRPKKEIVTPNKQHWEAVK